MFLFVCSRPISLGVVCFKPLQKDREKHGGVKLCRGSSAWLSFLSGLAWEIVEIVEVEWIDNVNVFRVWELPWLPSCVYLFKMASAYIRHDQTAGSHAFVPGRVWHPECFKCTHCEQPIVGSFCRIDGALTCVACRDALTEKPKPKASPEELPKCRGCKQPIEDHLGGEIWMMARTGRNWGRERRDAMHVAGRTRVCRQQLLGGCTKFITQTVFCDEHIW